MGHELDRRRILQLGAGASALALAGCLGDDSGDGGSLFTGSPPSYAQFLAAERSQGQGDGNETNGDDAGQAELFLGHLDIGAVQQLEDLGLLQGVLQIGGGPGSTPGEDQSGAAVGDGLIDFPLGATVFIGFASFGLSMTGLGSLLDNSGAEEGESEFDSELQAQTLANDAIILQGNLNLDEIDDLLENPPESDNQDNSFAPQPQPLEFVETVGDYDVYEAPEADRQGNKPAAAVDAETIIYGTTRSIVDETVGAATGERERATEAHDELARALGPAEDSQFLFGGYNPDGFDPENTAQNVTGGGSSLNQIDDVINGQVHGASIDDEGMDAAAAFVAQDPISEETEEIMNEVFGSEADELDIQVSGRQALVTGRYSNESLTSANQSGSESESGG